MKQEPAGFVPAPSLSRSQIRLLLAHHEAAHAVVAMLGGMRVTSLELREYTEDEGWSADGITFVTYFPRLSRALAVQGAAGELAAVKWLEENGLHSEETVAASKADHDRDEVIELLAENDLRIGLTEADPGDVSWPAVRAIAEALVHRLWPQISTVAHAVIDRGGHLTGDEITHLLCRPAIVEEVTR
ncbi:hypothetical protein [Streptomyces sp. NPDC001930]|uniref:hypothetical protein n=1 Tax=Streptomyces sp. NPDC001930 TaxID=3364625 RepID=UPI003681C020